MQQDKIFWFHVIDADNENLITEGERIIKQFVLDGFKLHNLLIFTSVNDLHEIHKHIIANKSKAFMYFLTDMTGNMSPDTFKGMVNKKYYKYATELSDVLKQYKPIIKPKIDETRYLNSILDQISERGIESLNSEQKAFLEDSSLKK